jgi:hypothetical protein
MANINTIYFRRIDCRIATDVPEDYDAPFSVYPNSDGDPNGAYDLYVQTTLESWAPRR